MVQMNEYHHKFEHVATKVGAKVPHHRLGSRNEIIYILLPERGRLVPRALKALDDFIIRQYYDFFINSNHECSFTSNFLGGLCN